MYMYMYMYIYIYIHLPGARSLARPPGRLPRAGGRPKIGGAGVPMGACRIQDALDILKDDDKQQFLDNLENWDCILGKGVVRAGVLYTMWRSDS